MVENLRTDGNEARWLMVVEGYYEKRGLVLVKGQWMSMAFGENRT